MKINKVKQIMLGMLLLASVLLVSGCQKLEPVVNGAYGLVVKVENYVTEVDSATLVNTVDSLKTPLTIAQNATVYIASKVSNEDVKENLVKVADTLGTVLLLAENVNLDNVDAVKVEILAKIADVKDQVEGVADSLGIVLAEPKSFIDLSEPRGVVDYLEALNIDANDLDKLIK